METLPILITNDSAAGLYTSKGTLTEGECSVQLTSPLRKAVFKEKEKNLVAV